jgi:hypothetical protein
VTTATTTVMTVAAAVPSASPASALAGGNQVAVVDVPNDDVPPPGWGQWGSLPAPAPEPPVGVLVMREDVCVMSGCPTHGAEASSSRATLHASGGATTRLEQKRERANAPPDHFSEAQAEQALWQEFRDHGTSLNRALNEALWIHGGPTWRIFQVCDFSPGFAVFLLSFLPRLCFPGPMSSLALSSCDRSSKVGPGRDTTLSTGWTPSLAGTGSSATPSTPSSRP